MVLRDENESCLNLKITISLNRSFNSDQKMYKEHMSNINIYEDTGGQRHGNPGGKNGIKGTKFLT